MLFCGEKMKFGWRIYRKKSLIIMFGADIVHKSENILLFVKSRTPGTEISFRNYFSVEQRFIMIVLDYLMKLL